MCYDQVLMLDKKNRDAWTGKGLALRDLGQTVEAMACYDQQLPFAHDNVTVMDFIKDGEKEEIPKEYSDFVQQCWDLPDERPSARTLVSALVQAKPQEILQPESKPYEEKSWHFDPQTKAKRPAKDKIYELVEATDKDKRKVIEFYQHHPVAGYDMASVRVIYNPDMNYKFGLYLKELQQRNNNPAFQPKWPTGKECIQDPIEPQENINWRGKVHQQLQIMANSYQDSDYPCVNLLPMWHGTKAAIVDSIFRTGYANLATTDSGFFGKGIYGAHEAKYSYRVYAEQSGSLILNWTACFSAYPVIDGDMKKLEEKGSYTNYDAYFVPVVLRNPNNPNKDTYYPTKPNESHVYTELVVFQSAACLPRYLVELQPTLPKTVPPPSTGGYPGVFFPAAQNQAQGQKPTQDQKANVNIFNYQ